MQEFQFTANTPSGERATAIAGGATLVGVMLLMFVIFDLLLPDLLPSRALFWVVVVVPAIVAFSIVVRRMQHSTLGEYTLRLDGRHLTVICPNQTVIDLGEVQRTAIDRHKGDGKCADFAIAGSKDQRSFTSTAHKGDSACTNYLPIPQPICQPRIAARIISTSSRSITISTARSTLVSTPQLLRTPLITQR